MKRNIDRLSARATALGVSLRPHLKTTKSVDAARYVLTNGNGPATVSTLAEAEAFAKVGITDIIYAVGITASKLDRVIALHRSGCNLIVLLDNVEQAQAVASASRSSRIAIPALIEIDCDGHRSGLTFGGCWTDPDARWCCAAWCLVSRGRQLRRCWCCSTRKMCRAGTACSGECSRGVARGWAAMSRGECWLDPNGTCRTGSYGCHRNARRCLCLF